MKKKKKKKKTQTNVCLIVNSIQTVLPLQKKKKFNFAAIRDGSAISIFYFIIFTSFDLFLFIYPTNEGNFSHNFTPL